MIKSCEIIKDLDIFSLGMENTDSDTCNGLRKDRNGSCYISCNFLKFTGLGVGRHHAISSAIFFRKVTQEVPSFFKENQYYHSHSFWRNVGIGVRGR